MKKKIVHLSCLLALTVFSLKAQSPNFVLILSDDQGWNGTSVLLSMTESGSKSDYYETPALEELASQGMVFSAAYSPAPKCSPTRNSIQTGMTTARTGFTNTDNQSEESDGLIEAITLKDIDDSAVTLPEWLNGLDANYRTAHFGKWHIGNNGPAANGYDSEDGNNSNDEGTAADGESVQDDPKKIFELTHKGIDFMSESVEAGDPFYLQLSHYAVHTSVEYTEEAFDKYDNKTTGSIHDNVGFASMTEDLDDGVRLIMNAIEDLDIADNTYIIYTSDNGASSGQSNNAPLSRGKTFLYEGGIRVPMIVRGPGIEAGKLVTDPVIGYDLYPTFAEATGASNELPTALDGVSLLPLWQGGSIIRSQPLIFHSPHYDTNKSKNPTSAAILGDYKLLVDYVEGTQSLYHIHNDVAESTDLSSAQPEMKLDLWIALRDYLLETGALYPSLNPTLFSSSDAADLDEDGLNDYWEISQTLSFDFNGDEDLDGDGLTLAQEFENNLDPLLDEDAVEEVLSAVDQNHMVVYPNPAKHQLLVSTDFEHSMELEVRIYSLSGVLEHVNIDQIPEGVSMSVDHLSKGIYFVEVIKEGLSFRQKVVLQ